MVSFTDIPFDLNTGILAQQFGLQPSVDRAEELEALVQEVQKNAGPKALYKVSFIEEKGNDTITFDGATFTSRVLRKTLDEIERVFPFVVTGGPGIDALKIDPTDAEKQLWLGYIKGATVTAIIQFLTEHIKKTHKVPKLAFMYPGQGAPSVWPHEQIKELYSICGDVEKRIGVKLTESLLMIPSASSAGIFFPTEVDFQSCQLCQNETCILRQAPFDKKLWESVHQR